MSQWVSGTSTPTTQNLEAAVAACDASMSEFWGELVEDQAGEGG